tara:strand:- start:2416 stop:5058 length:2643 start_codon:yes stop_codon:yes gene_type:complete
MTGQPEAFLPFLAPLLGSLAGSSLAGGALATGLGLGSLGATAMGAIGSGLATTAVTGDIKQGLMAGISGYGIGSAVQGASAALDPAVVESASALADSSGELASITNLANTGATTADNIARSQVLNAPAFTESTVSGASDLPFGDISFNPESIRFQQGNVDALTSQAGKNVAENFSGDPMKFAGEFGKQLMTPQSILPIAVGEGMRGEDMAKDDFRDAVNKMKADKQATLDRSTAVRDASIDLAKQDYGYSGYAGGGLVSIDPNEYARQMNGVQTVGMFTGGLSEYLTGRGNPEKPGETQRTLRPANVVTADQLQKEADALVAQGRDPRAGFTGEINYFRQTPEEAGIPVPPVEEPEVEPSINPSTGVDSQIGMMPNKGGVNPYNANGTPSQSSIEPYVMPDQLASIANSTATATPIFTPADMDSIANPQAATGIASLAREAQSSRDSAKSAIDLIGTEEPLVPIYGLGGIRSSMAGVGGLNFAEGGITEIEGIRPSDHISSDWHHVSTNQLNVNEALDRSLSQLSKAKSNRELSDLQQQIEGAWYEATGRERLDGLATEIYSVNFENPESIKALDGRIIQRMKDKRIAEREQSNFAEGGITSIDPNAQQMAPTAMPSANGYGPEMRMQGELSMDGGGMQMMTEQEVMGVASQVANAFAQGITAEKLPPALVEQLRKATGIYGEEAVMQMIMQLSSQGQPPQVDNRPVMPPQEMPASGLGAEMGFPQPDPKTYNFQEGGVTPNPEIQLVEQTISAVLGKVSQEEADIIINMFISEFGQEAFEMLREKALQSVVPNAQTEGVIRGQGGGMDDMVNGMIGTEQPVAVSPGEYIVPADVVSGLGDGSTDGGVQELDGMLDRVRQTRTGTTTQPAPMRTGGVLPA